MIHDIVRATLIVAVLACSAAILLETRERLAVIDTAARLMVAHHPQPMPMPVYQPVPQPEQGRLQRLGGAVTNLADAALSVIR